MLISRTRYITVTVPLSIQEYRWFFFTFITISIYNTASPDIVLVRKLTYISVTCLTMKMQNYVYNTVCE